MGRRHIEVVRLLGLNLAGISDHSPDALRLAQDEHGISSEQCFRDATALLDRTKPECVIVATTAPAHCEYTCLAAEAAAKYILCEKPMAVSLAECDRMIEVCRDHGVKLAVNHPRRFMEQLTRPFGLIESTSFGGLSSMTVIGGNLGMAMNGTHYFEMFRHMTREAPVQVTAWFYASKVPNPRGPQFDDPAGAIRLSTASGKRMYMDIGADQGHGVRVVYAGPYGQIDVDELSGTMRATTRKEEARGLPSTRYDAPSSDTETVIEAPSPVGPSAAVLYALLNDGGAPSGEDGRAAVQVLVAAYVSNDRGSVPVRPDRGLPRERVFPWA
jgi:predicted dehydrogenase